MRLSQRAKLKQHHNSLMRWVDGHRQLLLKVGGGLIGLLLLIQLFYPGSKLPLFASVDGVPLSGWNKTDAIKALDARYKAQHVAVSLSETNGSYDSPLAADLGIKSSNQSRIEQATYPWYVRIIPTSLVWFGFLQHEQPPTYAFDEAKAKDYLTHKVGEGCVIPAKDASLSLDGNELKLVAAKSGGTCDEATTTAIIAKLKPRINKQLALSIPVTVIAPKVGDDEAKKLADRLNKATRGGIRLKAGDKTPVIEQKEVLSWLSFSGTDDGLTFTINKDKANAYFAKTVTPLVAKPAGVTKISTEDFTETSRNDGAPGQTIALEATLADVTTVLNGQKQVATVSVTSLAPKVEYTRTYSKSSTGIAALLKYYDDDNAGSFGVSFRELGGQGLSAQHNADQQFVTASTYKLFVAFSTIKRVEAGQMSWSDADISSGRDLTKCFDDMIVKSDNACAEALIKKIGAKDLNSDIKSLGLSSTAFRSDNNVTTANDLANYLTQLETGTMPIKSENRTRLLGAMKRNVYRQGVPAGASGPVADKVGFLWGLLNDAAIVYSPKGTYILAIMSDGSAWGNLADLTRKIEALR